ncbi:hypothetical protein BLNAU_12681 [Blattamonas nauphoetae]|uniref:Uncharacterized protein n=1 Tax=Blattamonas nauphoetae TaxID=2049346 RepID=A0ABQ9XNP4_9EUKA|nr:hypothetical protein BLNAU_12681 [Blattamonas nauphoetae]
MPSLRIAATDLGTDSEETIPESLDYFVYLKTRVSQIDKERNEWSLLFEECQPPPSIIHTRATRQEKRRRENVEMKQKFENVKQEAVDHRQQMEEAEENRKALQVQLRQDEKNIRTLTKITAANGPDITFFLDENRFH